MKRFIHFTLVLALAIGVVSCKKDDIVNTAKETTKDVPTVKNLPPKQKITLSASSTKSGLRVAYDASKGTDVTDDNTLWEENDQIAVYNVGVNGAPAIFTLVDGAGTSYGTFEGVIEPTGNYYGVYPASAAGMLDGTSIAITLPKNQNYAEGSFGTDAAVFAATYDAPNDVLKFEPLLGYLSLSLTTPSNTSRDANSSIVGGHSVGSIVLHENSLGGISLSGNATVDMSSDIPKFISAPAGGGLDVTLNCPSVQLTSSPTEFIIAVPAGAFSKGLCATVKDPSGKKIMSIATTTPNVITTNYITKLPAQVVYNIEDKEGYRYPVAKIGSYVWTSENMRSLTYDTESGCTDVVINYQGDSHYYDPFYMDPTTKALWDPNDDAMKNPSDYNEVCSQLSRWGYLYNWAAAVGLKDAQAAYDQVTYFPGFRQGICPNGWHVPTGDEYYDYLTEYVVNGLPCPDDEPAYVAGTFLKSVEGWSSFVFEGYDLDRGTDDFGFSMLPTGESISGRITEVGSVAMLWTAWPNKSKPEYYMYAWIFLLYNYSPMFGYSSRQSKSVCRAVRCLKDY
ncbi:MAG: hypothetical protein IJP50_01515 [Paludibacteraceae bacterium]|nr:hypothetical protein [Paludibacteraceae bacterium]